MRRDAALLVPAVVLVVLTSGCDFLTHEKGETDYSASPEKKANVKLVNCAAAIEGREIVVKGELVNNLPGTTDVRVDYNFTPAEKPDWVAASTENPVPMVPGRGRTYSFQQRYRMPDTWRLPDVRSIHVGIRTGIGDWSTTLYLATVNTLYCLARDTGEMDVEVLVAFVNNCEAGIQTVDFEPYIAYELPDAESRRPSASRWKPGCLSNTSGRPPPLPTG